MRHIAKMENRKCKHCLKPLIRRQKEKPSRFRNRNSCSRECHFAWLEAATPHKTCANCGLIFSRDKRCTWKHWEKAKFCSRECSSIQNTVRADQNRPPVEVVFRKWFKETEGCWEWQGAKDKNGYGAFSYARKMTRAHVMALILDGRPPPKGMYACHHCDNPSCVRPSHLFVGSPQDNVDDMVLKGRVARGENRTNTKLKEKDVISIRAMNGSNSQIAKMFGITPSNVSMIQRRKTWKHLP